MLTFGRRAPAALRDRIEARIGRADPGGRRAVTTMAEPVVRTFPAYAFGLLRLAATERGEPAPRLLTGSEQDAVIREMLDAPGRSRPRWPASLRQAVRTRAFAAELRDLLLRARRARHRAAYARRPRAASTAGRSGSAAAGFLEEYVRVLALRDATTRGSVAYDQAELVRAAAALLVDDPGAARRRTRALPVRLRRRAGRHRPRPDRPARPDRRRRRARGRLRRPRLGHLRLPRW